MSLTPILRTTSWFVAILMMAAASIAWGQRRVLSLDGMWDVEQGRLDEGAATRFSRQTPVPGTLAQAQPPFEQIGLSSSRREVFWLRRTFQITGPVPEVALLKIHKAKYGTKVWLNGVLLGEHLPCFTPGYFDAHHALRGHGQPNELLVRLGAWRDSVPGNVVTGWDYEKSRYLPGIYDQVELILTGSPHVERIQAAPQLADNTLRIQTVVRNREPTVQAVRLRYRVRERASGKLVAEAESATRQLPPSGEATLDDKLAMAPARRWSPEDPFLYTLEVSTGADQQTVTFGMRSFTFNPATKRAELNGQARYLRGTNVCIFRFFEDPQCRDKPWNEAWVRRLHRQFKRMHWDTIRYCIGPPPEMWYRIADEEGLLIQDEYPLWYSPGNRQADWPAELSSEDVAAEFTQWLHARVNHPCVVIWDACNESNNRRTTAAIARVRAIDLSNRPWENSNQGQMRPTDCWEAHPYRYQKPEFHISQLATMDPFPSGHWGPKKSTAANVIINEYGWLWVNRDGTPCTLSRKALQQILGRPASAGPDDYRRASARHVAMLTEFWRSYRQAAAVMHFCGLGYSRAEGQTSDNWIDLDRLEFEPHFQSYVGDAFAPVGLMIEDWTTEILLDGQPLQHDFRVRVINDRETAWAGDVRLCLFDDQHHTLHDAKQSCTVASLGQTSVAFAAAWPATPGHYRLVASLTDRGDQVQSERQFDVRPATWKAPRQSAP